LAIHIIPQVPVCCWNLGILCSSRVAKVLHRYLEIGFIENYELKFGVVGLTFAFETKKRVCRHLSAANTFHGSRQSFCAALSAVTEFANRKQVFNNFLLLATLRIVFVRQKPSGSACVRHDCEGGGTAPATAKNVATELSVSDGTESGCLAVPFFMKEQQPPRTRSNSSLSLSDRDARGVRLGLIFKGYTSLLSSPYLEGEKNCGLDEATCVSGSSLSVLKAAE
jgi:hypothetical protein